MLSSLVKKAYHVLQRKSRKWHYSLQLRARASQREERRKEKEEEEARRLMPRIQIFQLLDRSRFVSRVAFGHTLAAIRMESRVFCVADSRYTISRKCFICIHQTNINFAVNLGRRTNIRLFCRVDICDSFETCHANLMQILRVFTLK